MTRILIVFMLLIPAFGFSAPSESITRILNSGDGKSYHTAYEVYTVDEEYQFIEYLELNPKMQMLTIINGEYFDVLQVGDSLVWFKLITKPDTMDTIL